jgi:hypothetical protein
MVDAFGIHLVSGMFLDELKNLVCLLALGSNGAIVVFKSKVGIILEKCGKIKIVFVNGFSNNIKKWKCEWEPLRNVFKYFLKSVDTKDAHQVRLQKGKIFIII